MKQYHHLVHDILHTGTKKEAARAGMPGTISLFGKQFRCNLSEGFPLLTTKKMHYKGIIVELLWFLKGLTNVKYLVDNNCNIWNDDAYRKYKNWVLKKDGGPLLTKEEYVDMIGKSEGFASNFGDLGPVYGKQWRNFNGVDQVLNVINSIRKTPNGRRHIISAWNPAEIEEMALPPCHLLIQFNCREYEHPSFVGKKWKLDCSMYMRSADVFLGVPFNIASYALLTHIVAELTGYEPGDLIISFGDVHLYDNHVEAATELLNRSYSTFKLPKLTTGLDVLAQQEFNCHISELPADCISPFIDKMRPDHFAVENYQSFESIKAELSVGV